MKKAFVTTIAAAALLFGLNTGQAAADFGLKNLDMVFETCTGDPDMRAGAHPCDWTTSFAVNTVEKEVIEGGVPKMIEAPDGEARDIVVDFPPGLIGDPFAVPRCSTADFLAMSSGAGVSCPDASAIGVHELTFGFGAPGDRTVPVYNMVPPPGKAVRIGFSVLNVPVTVEAGIRSEPPYAAYAETVGIPQAAFYYATKAFTVWGNPASPIHDDERSSCAETTAADSCPVSIPERPFVTLPRACTGPLTTTFKARSWQNPGDWFMESIETHNDATPPSPQGMGGCSQLILSPQITSQLSSDHAESPSGLAFELEIDDLGIGNPEGRAQSDIKKTVVTLPDGVTINPSQAEGLDTCTPSQFAAEKADSNPGAGCPEASKIGSVEVESPLIEGEIFKGSVFVAQQDDPTTTEKGKENPFDSLIALYLTVKSPRYGVNVGLAGKVEPNPKTGQIVTTFDDIPQLPFSNFRLNLREGGRSPLVTPASCDADPSTSEADPYVTVAEFTPWANPTSTVTTTASFKVTKGVGGGDCPPGGTPPFDPGFAAGTINNNAASHSPFVMRLQRRDGDQDLTRFDAVLPPGMVAKLAGVSKCSDAAIASLGSKTGRAELASPACPANSKIGRVMAGAGVGSQLTYVPGSVYLAGSFGGAPLSVVGVVPAVAGPFDVGVVATRQALVVDPRTAKVKVDGALSDPIPHILAGIPLRVRDIQVHVDRSEFTLNPTSCDPFATAAEIWGGGSNPFSTVDNSPVPKSARFQASNCSRLDFKPRLSLRLKGGTRRGGHPALHAVLRARAGDANLETTIVRLPRSAFLDQAHIRTICTRVQFAADACPAGSIYGRVKAFTPLLDEPLEGPAFLRSSDNLLPDLVFDLHGLVDIESSARIDSIKGGIRAIFAGIPDAPLSKVVVNMQGGEKGLIVNSRNLCAAKSRAKVQIDGQNGKRTTLKPVVSAGCGKGRKQRRR